MIGTSVSHLFTLTQLYAICQSKVFDSEQTLELIERAFKPAVAKDNARKAYSIYGDEPEMFSGESPWPEVQVKQGRVRGTTYPESHTFYGIPYAQPPVKDLR